MFKKSKPAAKNDKSTKKERKQEVVRVRSVQNAIRYKQMLKNGLCILDDDTYSICVQFSDIDYQMLGEEDKLKVCSDYMSLVNTFAQDMVDLQLTINNRMMDREMFEREKLIPVHNDGFNDLRFELNRQRKQALIDGHNKIEPQKMFTISGRYPNAQEADSVLGKHAKNLEKALRRMGCDEVKIMSGRERLESLYSIIKPGNKFNFDYDRLALGDNTKNYISPYAMDFKKSPSFFKMDDRFCQGMYLSDWPTELSDAFFEELMTLEHNMLISFHMSMVPRKKAIDYIKYQLDDMQSQIQKETKRNFRAGGADMIPFSMKEEYEAAESLLQKITATTQNFFRVQMVILTNSETKEQMEAVKRDIETVGQSHMCTFLPMTYEQEDAFNTALPFGKPKPKMGRSLLSDGCVMMMPFSTKEKSDSLQPVYYGTNRTTHNMILANRRLLPNPSGFILGKPGFGKSFAAKLESVSVLLSNPDADIFFIDPQGEYAAMAYELNKKAKNTKAAVLKVDSYSDLHFNPFDGDPSEPDFIQRKSKFIEYLIAEMIGKGELLAQEKTQIGQVCMDIFNEFRDSSAKDPTVLPPTLQVFAAKMKEKASEGNPFAANIYESLWPFVDGSSNLFSQQGNVDISSSFLVFDIHDLDDSIRTLSMKVILEILEQRVKANHKIGKSTYVYIDEIYLLLKDPYSEQFLYEFWKWCRKFGAVVTGITQNVSELLCSQQACTMLSNSEFCLMLSQSQSDLFRLKELFRLSDIEEDELLYADKGEGLIKFGNTIIPFENHFPENTDLFRIWNTDPAIQARFESEKMMPPVEKEEPSPENEQAPVQVNSVPAEPENVQKPKADRKPKFDFAILIGDSDNETENKPEITPAPVHKDIPKMTRNRDDY